MINNVKIVYKKDSEKTKGVTKIFLNDKEFEGCIRYEVNDGIERLQLVTLEFYANCEIIREK